MTPTIYSFHNAADHQIIATATPENLQDVAEQITAATTGTKRLYVHNGLGVICVARIAKAAWHDLDRESPTFANLEPAGRAIREAAGYPLDPR